MTPQTKSELISRIIELEYTITIAVINGHRPYNGDQFHEIRSEVNTLRCLVFGYESQFCKKILVKR